MVVALAPLAPVEAVPAGVPPLVALEVAIVATPHLSANTIFVAKTSGFILDTRLSGVIGRVGILPAEYYTDMIVTLFDHYGVQIGMDSSVILDGDIAFDLETRDIVKIDYFSGRHLIFFDSGWIGCAPVCLTMGSDYRFAPNLVLLRAAPPALSLHDYRWEPRGRRGGRCSKAMWHVCARWRARRAVKAAQMEEERIMFLAEQVFGRRCGCIECCARTRCQAQVHLARSRNLRARQSPR